MRSTRLAAAVFVAMIAAVPGTAAAEGDERLQVQRMRFVERGDRLHVTTSLAKLFDRAAYEALDSGFTSTIVIRMWIYPRDATDPVAFMLLQRQVLYNLWDEVYELKLDEPGAPPGTRKVVTERRKSEALKRLTSLDDVPIARLADLPLEEVFLLAMEVELNPVSRETLAQVRRWLSQGTGGGLDRGGAYFGSFVSVFVNPKIADADRELRLRSQPFYRPRR